MAGAKVDVDATGVVAEMAGLGIGYAMGTTAPSDGAVGFSPYSIFCSSSGALMNFGTKSSANFDPIGSRVDTITEFTAGAGVKFIASKIGFFNTAVTTQPGSISAPAAISSGDSPTEAEHNAVVTAVASIIGALEDLGLLSH